jgi:predicted DNA-binding transcriptional regulator AlpA
MLAALLSASEAAKLLRLASQTLAKKRVEGTGPRYVKLGRRVFYDPADLSEWIEANKRHNTSERGGGQSVLDGPVMARRSRFARLPR